MSLQNGFVSEVFRPQYGLIRSRSGVHLDATIPASLLPSIPITVDVSEDKLVSGQAIDHVVGRLSSFYRGLSVTNFVDWTFSRGQPQLTEPIALGDLLISKFVRNYGLRGEVLYNLEPIFSRDVFIEVDDQVHYWIDDPLFIFDDTNFHRSINDVDHVRYCLFMDIVRPNYSHKMFDMAVHAASAVSGSFKRIFYKHWSFVR
jgi:hypothetical protein